MKQIACCVRWCVVADIIIIAVIIIIVCCRLCFMFIVACLRRTKTVSRRRAVCMIGSHMIRLDDD